MRTSKRKELQPNCAGFAGPRGLVRYGRIASFLFTLLGTHLAAQVIRCHHAKNQTRRDFSSMG